MKSAYKVERTNKRSSESSTLPAIILSNHSIPRFTEAVSMGGALGVDDLLLDMEAEEASGCLFCIALWRGSVCVCLGWGGDVRRTELKFFGGEWLVKN